MLTECQTAHIHFPAAAFCLLIHCRGKRCTIRFHTSGFTCDKIHTDRCNDAAAMMIVSNVWKGKIQFFCATGNLCHYVEWGKLHAILKKQKTKHVLTEQEYV